MTEESETQQPVRHEPTYCGDGLYASFDGWQIAVAVNHHENVVAYFDPEVFEQFKRFGNKCFGIPEKP